MEIKEIQIGLLKPYENNTKIHTFKQIEEISNSIQQFGFKQPIVIDKDGAIIVGHGRYEAAKMLSMEVVPCVVADDLTEDEAKAYRIADNKTNESDWDFKALEKELDEIDIDMTLFNADFGEEFEEIEENHRQSQIETQRRVANILNLENGDYEGDGYYGIPMLDPVFEVPEIKDWIGFNYVLSDKEPEGKAVHFFVDDYQFERIWNNPERYVEKLRRYVCVATPDFSPYADMPRALQIYNHYRKHWVGRWLQDRGVVVIPTIRCNTDPESLKWFLDGTPKGGIVAISSMWSKETHEIDAQSYRILKEKIDPCKIFVYGGNTGNIGIEDGDNIETIKNFAQKRFEND